MPLFITFVIVASVVGIINMMFRIYKSGKRDLLDKQFKEGDIDAGTYRKYMDEL